MVRVLVLGFALMLSGCAALGSSEQPPKGIGRGTDDLKKSPCACGEPFYKGGQWVS